MSRISSDMRPYVNHEGFEGVVDGGLLSTGGVGGDVDVDFW